MGAIIVIAIFVVGVLVFMALAALTVGTAGALFLDQGFIDSWHAAWNRPGWLFLFAVLASALLGSRNKSN